MEGTLTFHSDCFNHVVSAIKDVAYALDLQHEELDKVVMKYCFQWAGPVEDLGEEFDKIDENGGGQVVTIIALLLTSILNKRGNKCVHVCVCVI